MTEPTTDIDAAAPAVYLRRPPSAEETELAAIIDGAASTLVTARIALRVHAIAAWVATVDGTRRSVQRAARWCAGLVAANFLIVGAFVVHRIESAALAEERMSAQQRALDELRGHVWELRAEVRRISGLDAPDSNNIRRDYPDQFTSVGPVGQLLVGGIGMFSPSPSPSPKPRPDSCGQWCNSNQECGQDITRSCPYCNFGTCRSVRPDEPITDAGVPTDATPKRTTP